MAARIWLPEGAEQAPVPAILSTSLPQARLHARSATTRCIPTSPAMATRRVRVDMRGSGDSDGLMIDEYLAAGARRRQGRIAWLAEQPWCTGKVGMIGSSWGGFNALQVAALRPPALKAIITSCSTDDRYADDMHYMGGAPPQRHSRLGLDRSSTLAARGRPTRRSSATRWRRDVAGAARGLELRWSTTGCGTSAATPSGSTARSTRTTRRSSARSSRSAAGSTATPTRSRGCSPDLKVPRLGLIGALGPRVRPPGRARARRSASCQEALRWWDHWLKGQDTGIMDEPMLRGLDAGGGAAARPLRRRPGAGWPSPPGRRRGHRRRGAGTSNATARCREPAPGATGRR